MAIGKLIRLNRLAVIHEGKPAQKALRLAGL
jgi:hypothetical protein